MTLSDSYALRGRLLSAFTIASLARASSTVGFSGGLSSGSEPLDIEMLVDRCAVVPRTVGIQPPLSGDGEGSTPSPSAGPESDSDGSSSPSLRDVCWALLLLPSRDLGEVCFFDRRGDL